jgi:ribose transport system substrate-binding protein
MVERAITSIVRGGRRRRDLLRGAAALGALGAFPAIVRRSRLRERRADGRELDPLAHNPYHASWNAGGAASRGRSGPST